MRPGPRGYIASGGLTHVPLHPHYHRPDRRERLRPSGAVRLNPTQGNAHMTVTLLSSAPSLDAISKSIARFYCGEEKTLAPTAPDAWAVIRSDGRECSGVRVIRKGHRYRFEMLPV